MRVLIWFHIKEIHWSLAEAHVESLRVRFPGVTFVQACDEAELARELPQADVLFGFELPAALRLKAERRWDRVAAIFGGTGMRALAGTNLAVLGAGAIGAGIACRAAALEMNVRVMRRRPGQPVDGAQAVVGFDRLHDLLGWADTTVIALPLTRETHHLIDERALAGMKRSAHLINVGRGEIVDKALGYAPL